MEHINSEFCIPKETLEERIGISFCRKFEYIIPLRNIETITDMHFFKICDFEQLIRHVPLRREEEHIFPYKDAIIEIYGTEPLGIAIGQTFVLQEKLLEIMQSMRTKFNQFVTKGISKMPPVQV